MPTLGFRLEVASSLAFGHVLLENVVTVESLAAFWTRVGSIKKKRELGDRNYTYREVWGHTLLFLKNYRTIILVRLILQFKQCSFSVDDNHLPDWN